MGLKSRYSFLKRINLETLTNTFLGFNPREQMFVLVGAVVALLLAFGLPLGLASAKLGSLEAQIHEGRENQREVLRRLEKHQQLQGKLKTVESQIAKGFDATITTTMATLAEASGIKDRIQNIRDKGATSAELFDKMTVEVKLIKLTVPQLIDYLYRIEQHSELFLRLDQIRVKRRFDNKQLLDVTFEASTYRLQQVGGT